MPGGMYPQNYMAPTQGGPNYLNIPQIPDRYPYGGDVATPPPELLERLRTPLLPQNGVHFQGGLPVFPQGGQSMGPGAAAPRRNSTTIMVLPGKNSKQLKDMVEMMGDGFGSLSPIFKALMGKDKD